MRPLLLSLLLLGCKEGAAVSGPPPGPAPQAASAPTASTSSDAVVAWWKDGKLTYAEIQAQTDKEVQKLASEYLMQRFDLETEAVDQKVTEALLAAEAKATGAADANALLKKEIEDKVAAPTDAEVQEAYDALKRKLGGRPLEEVRPTVEGAVKQRKQAELFQSYVADLKKKYGVEVQLPFPDLPRIAVSVDDDPFLGPADAPVTVIQFADYQCPYCGRAQETVDEVMKAYDGKVKFVFRDFPLSGHQQATPAAIAANCAGQQGKFWEVHGQIMKDQRALSDADLERLAVNAQVDLGKWNECRKDPSMNDEVQKDLQDGVNAGVSGTPAFFVNGVFINGARPFELFKSVIDRELAPPKG